MTSPLYGRRWKKARVEFLAEHPRCTLCHEQGRVTPAEEVHHSPPHKGDPEAFWNQETWVPLCRGHHLTAGRQQDLKGFHSEVGADGWPLDQNHPVYRTGPGEGKKT